MSDTGWPCAGCTTPTRCNDRCYRQVSITERPVFLACASCHYTGSTHGTGGYIASIGVGGQCPNCKQGEIVEMVPATAAEKLQADIEYIEHAIVAFTDEQLAGVVKERDDLQAEVRLLATNVERERDQKLKAWRQLAGAVEECDERRRVLQAALKGLRSNFQTAREITAQQVEAHLTNTGGSKP